MIYKNKKGSILANVVIIFLFLFSIFFPIIGIIEKEISLAKSSIENTNLYNAAEDSAKLIVDILNKNIVLKEKEINEIFFNEILKKDIENLSFYETDIENDRKKFDGKFFITDEEKLVIDGIYKSIVFNMADKFLNEKGFKQVSFLKNYYFIYNIDMADKSSEKINVNVSFNFKIDKNEYYYEFLSKAKNIKTENFVTYSGKIKINLSNTNYEIEEKYTKKDYEDFKIYFDILNITNNIDKIYDLFLIDEENEIIFNNFENEYLKKLKNKELIIFENDDSVYLNRILENFNSKIPINILVFKIIENEIEVITTKIVDSNLNIIFITKNEIGTIKNVNIISEKFKKIESEIFTYNSTFKSFYELDAIDRRILTDGLLITKYFEINNAKTRTEDILIDAKIKTKQLKIDSLNYFKISEMLMEYKD